MKKWIDQNPMIALLYVVFILVAVVGGILVLIDASGALTYDEYLNNLTKFALAVGVFGAGRAVKNGLLQKDVGHGLPPEDEDDFSGEDDVEPYDPAVHDKPGTVAYHPDAGA